MEVSMHTALKEAHYVARAWQSSAAIDAAFPGCVVVVAVNGPGMSSRLVGMRWIVWHPPRLPETAQEAA